MSLSPVDLSLQTTKTCFPKEDSCARSDLSGVLLRLIGSICAALICEKRKLKPIIDTRTEEKTNLKSFNAKNPQLIYLF
jgi:hypothetical protein